MKSQLHYQSPLNRHPRTKIPDYITKNPNGLFLNNESGLYKSNCVTIHHSTNMLGWRGGLPRFTRLVLSACQMQSAHGQMSVLLSGVNITFIFSLKMEVRSNPYRGLWGRYVGILSIFLLVTSSTRHLQNTWHDRWNLHGKVSGKQTRSS